MTNDLPTLPVFSFINVSFLMSFTTILSMLQALSVTEVDGPDPQLAEPQIAMFCGRQMLHMNLQTGQWEPDLQGRQGCFRDPNEILSYCQEVGPRVKGNSFSPSCSCCPGLSLK